jgi:hypothetical protein
VSDAGETPAIANQSIKTLEAVLRTNFRLDIEIPPKSLSSSILNFPALAHFSYLESPFVGAEAL